MLQRVGVEGRELDHHARRQLARIEREVAAADARTAAERRGDVPHRGEVTHLLDGHIEQYRFQRRTAVGLLGVQPLGLPVLQAERRRRDRCTSDCARARRPRRARAGVLHAAAAGLLRRRRSRKTPRARTARYSLQRTPPVKWPRARASRGSVMSGQRSSVELQIDARRREIHQRAAVIDREVVVRLGAELLELALIAACDPARGVTRSRVEHALHAVFVLRAGTPPLRTAAARPRRGSGRCCAAA